MSSINFDDFEREIRQAESYLKSASAKASPSNAEEERDTIFFASDLRKEPSGQQDEMINFGSSPIEAPSSSAQVVDPLMDTIRFGTGNNAAYKYESAHDDHSEDLFYASDVLASQSRKYDDEDMLSFLPSPQQTQNLDYRHTSDTSQLSASLADTIRFTKPVEPALRSMDNTSVRVAPQRAASGGRSRPNATGANINTTNNTSYNINDTSKSSNYNTVNSSVLNSSTADYSTASNTRRSINSTTNKTNNSTNNNTTNNTSTVRTASPAKFVRQAYVPETIGPRRSANAISMNRIEELHRKRIAAKQELLKKKRALDELQLAECTFRPQISRGTRVILHQKQQFELLGAELAADENTAVYNTSSNNRLDNRVDSRGEYARNTEYVPPSSGDVSERLYREASIRSAQQHWINVQVQHLREAEYTFQPSIHHTSNNTTHTNTANNTNKSVEARAMHALDRRPIHERLADVMKQKKQYLLALKTSIEEEQVDLTFQPRIDARSRAIAEQKLTGYGANHNLPRSSGSAHPNANPSVGISSGGKLSGEQQMALVMGFNNDVGSRLIDQGRVMAKRKQQLAQERDNELAAAMEQVAISKGSAKIVQKADLKETFEQRQAQYKARERERQDAQLREREHLSSGWFHPHIDPRSSAIVHAQRPELSLESVEQKSTRLSVKDAQALEERRQARAAEMYGAIPFTPTIDALSRSLGRLSSIDDLVHNRRALSAREKVRQRVEEELNQECTFRPQINPLSKQLLQPSDDELFLQKYNSDYAQVGWAQGHCALDGIEPGIRDSFTRTQNGRINMAEPEKMQRDIRMHALAKEEKRRSELIAREIQELRECTFHPDIDTSLSSLARQQQDTSPVVIRGLGRFLELKHMTARQKEEALQREREVFSVKNIDQYRRAEDGSTVVQAFNFNLTEPRQHSRLDISGVEIHPGSLNASTIMSHVTSHRQPTSSAAAAAWCM